MRKLSKKDKKTLAIGAVVVAGILAVVYGMLPFLEARESVDEQVDQSVLRLQRSVQAVQNQEIYSHQLEQLDQILDQYRTHLLDAGDGTIARVQLQEMVTGLADQSGVKIARSNPLPDRNVGERYVKVSLQVNLEADIPEINNFLYAVATHPKFLLVEDFYINAFRLRDQIRMQPRMNISGYIRLSE